MCSVWNTYIRPALCHGNTSNQAQITIKSCLCTFCFQIATERRYHIWSEQTHCNNVSVLFYNAMGKLSLNDNN